MNIFDMHAREYDQWYEKNKCLYLSELKALRQLLPKQGKCLEIGVGTGRFAGPLGIKYGVEPSDNMAIIAEKRGVKVYKGIAEKLPFPDKSFDYVLFVTTLCFVKDIKKALKEARRVLRKNGVVIIGMLDKDSKLGRKYFQKREDSSFYRNAKLHSASEIIFLLKKYGFKTNKIIQTIFGECDKAQKFKKCSGEGLFVAIKSVKLSLKNL